MTQVLNYLTTIRQFFAFQDIRTSPKEQYRGNLLRIIIYGNLFGTILLASYGAFGEVVEQLPLLILVLIVGGINIWSLHLLKRGNIRLVSRLIIGVSWVTNAIGGYESGGVYSSAIMGMIVLIVTAILLLDMKARVVTYIVTLVYFFVLFFVEMTGNLPYAPIKDLPFRIVVLTTTLTILFLVINYHLYAFRQSEDQNVAFKVDSERFRVQQKLTQDLAHDLRTPLSTLIASVYLIKRRQEKGLPIDEAVSRLEDQSNRLDSLIEDLFQMTLLDLADKKQTLNIIPISTLLRQSVDDACQYANSRKIEVSFINQISEDKRIIGEYSQLKRAFDNLIENAIHYGRDNGHISVILSSDDKQMSVAIKDDGIGIAPENHAKIFERFYRVDSARNSSSQQGSGVGLNAVQRIIQLHSGNIKIDSALGKGSTFTVTLPYLKASQQLVSSEINPSTDVKLVPEPQL